MQTDLAALTWLIAARPEGADSSSAAGELDPGDPWLIAGAAALLIISLCLIGQWISSRQQKRFAVPHVACLAGVLATLILLAYALHVGEPVFIAAQALAVIVAFRLFVLARQIRRRRDMAAQLTFPRVSPETAERKYTESDSRTGISTRPS